MVACRHHATMRVQNESPQLMPLCYADCFGLKAKLALAGRLKRNFCPSLNYLEKLEVGALPITEYQR